MATSIGKTITFGATKKMKVISEEVLTDNNQYFSVVKVKGTRGAIKTAFRSYANRYYIVD